VKPQPLAVLREHAIDREHMDVDVQVQRASESLDDGHSTAATIDDAIPTRATSDDAEHGAHVHGDDRATQIVIPRQHVPQPVRQTQHPLSHRHVGEHMIHQVRRAFGHAPAATTGTEPAAFAREGHEAIVAAPIAMKPCESGRGRQASAGQKVAKLLLDEPRQAFAVSKRRRLCAEALEVFDDDLVQHAVGGLPRLVARRRLGHATRAGTHRASGRPMESALNPRMTSSNIAGSARP